MAPGSSQLPADQTLDTDNDVEHTLAPNKRYPPPAYGCHLCRFEDAPETDGARRVSERDTDRVECESAPMYVPYSSTGEVGARPSICVLCVGPLRVQRARVGVGELLAENGVSAEPGFVSLDMPATTLVEPLASEVWSQSER